MTATTADPVALGQVRRGELDGTLRVAAAAHGGRFRVEYPTLDYKSSILSADTIRQLYPTVVEG